MEKMSMKISEKDYKLLVGLVEFHFKFAEYIRESNQEMFYRAIDYAKTYTNSDGVQFDYWHEDNAKFLQELSTVLLKAKTSFDRLVSKVGGDEDYAKEIWMKKKKTNKEDLLGMGNYLSNFIRHAKELDYDSFTSEDWMNYVNICKYIDNDPKFIEFAKAQVVRVLGSDSDFLKGFANESEG
jgi:hypothetical protein